MEKQGSTGIPDCSICLGPLIDLKTILNAERYHDNEANLEDKEAELC